MKQIEVKVRSGDVDAVVRLGEEHGGGAPSRIAIERQEGEGEEDGHWHLVLVNLPNEAVGPFVMAVGDAVERADFVLPTTATLPIRTPIHDVRDRVADVTRRSTLELVLDVLQSLGTWKGMLLYAVVSGLVAAYGVLFNIWFLLTAAMLIAPLGAPAMVCVVAIVIGDGRMFRRGALRFVVALALLAVAAAALGLAYGLTEATALMEALTNLSVWSAMLGVVGGAAGAQALVQAERDSLVTATATGFLVAVSLSPPSAVLGLAAAIGRWDYVALMAFLLAVTFSGILLGGWASLRLQGVSSERPSAERGRGWLARGSVAAVALVLALLVVWQSQQGPSFQKADMIRSAARLAREGVRSVPGYRVLAADARFTPSDGRWHQGEGLLLRVVVTADTTGTDAGTGSGPPAASRGDPSAASAARADPSAASPESALRAAIRREVTAGLEGVRPFVELSILP